MPALHELLLIAALILSVADAQAEESIASLIEKAQGGNEEAQFNLGLKYAMGNGVPADQVEALKWYRSAALRGNSAAQVVMGERLLGGLAVPKDDVQAAMWFRLAAEQGFAAGQCNLGKIYSLGLGVSKDDVEAGKWFQLAAEQGFAEAQFRLGAAYANGQGVPKDYIEAYKWYNLAAAKNVEGASTGREKIASRMSPDQVAEAQKLAREWKAKNNKVTPSVLVLLCFALVLLIVCLCVWRMKRRRSLPATNGTDFRP